MSKQFRYTTQERRSSVIYSSSAGKGGLFLPNDYINEEAWAVDESVADDVSEESLLGINNSRTLQQQYSSNQQNMERPITSTNGLPKNLLLEERDLLVDNKLYDTEIIPDRHSEYRILEEDTLNPEIQSMEDREIMDRWEQAIESGKSIVTTYRRETKVISTNALPLVFTFVLQNSLSLASIFSVSHLGTNELGAVTLGSMTANITGFAAIQGLCTCLDTLCSQAYGAHNYHLVGILFQRCVVISIFMFLPVLFIWWFWSEAILSLFISEKYLCALAARYLQVVSLGIPGFILFEAGKRFLQSQGIFHASTIILLICAPLNAFMNYLLVWNDSIGIGYLGAPISVALNYWLMAFGLFFYTIFTKNKIRPLKCWNGLIKYHQVFKNWNKMFGLAFPGIIMVEAEFLGFELLTIFASKLGTDALAAQSIVSTIASLAYQIPFSISISTSTRVANFIGASLFTSSIISCKVSFILSFIVGVLNMVLIFTLRSKLAILFSSDPQIIELVSHALPILAIMQIFDAFNASSAGCLRGQGQQRIGGYINVFSFYCIGIPISYILTFNFGWGLRGLWWGITSGLIVMSIFQSYAIFNCDWETIVRVAKIRNNEGSVA